MISGEQRLRNVRTKARILARRVFVQFMAGERDWLPCLDDIEDVMIAHEFERIVRAKQ